MLDKKELRKKIAKSMWRVHRKYIEEIKKYPDYPLVKILWRISMKKLRAEWGFLMDFCR